MTTPARARPTARPPVRSSHDAEPGAPKPKRREQVEQQSQQAQKATAEQIENFKKAFSVCLEAKDYMVKF